MRVLKMSEEKDHSPTIHDLHIEQVQQNVKLASIATDVKEVKEILVGNGKRTGLVLDVDRLKRTRATTKAIVWVLFTTLLGAGAAVAVAAVTR
jgi:hypothetical protein